MKRASCFSVAAALAISAGLAQSAQEQHSADISKVVRLGRAPVSNELLRVNLPRPSVTKLPNGLTVLVLEQHRLPTVNVAMWIGAGDMYDPPDLPGLAHFTADMLQEGTAHRTSAQLAADIDNIGATLATSSSFGSTSASVTGSGLSTSTAQLLDLMSDVVLNPAFPAAELDKYKTRQLSELEQERAQPNVLARERFRRALYQDSPAAVTLATKESIDGVTPERLKAFYARYYVPGNTIIAIIGDVHQADVLETVRNLFGAWKGEKPPAAEWTKLPEPPPATIYLVDRPDSVQTNILAGDFGGRRTDPDYPALSVMNQIVGGGPQARLFLNLREEHGYTYGAYSRAGDDKYRQPWAANTEVRNAVTDGSVEQLMAEFHRIRDQKVPAAELDEARHAIVAAFALSLEQPNALLHDWLTVEYEGLPMNYWDHYPVEIADTSADAVQKAARKYVDLDHLQIVAVGDAKQAGNDQKQSIRDVLGKYGTVQVFDTNGKKLN